MRPDPFLSVLVGGLSCFAVAFGLVACDASSSSQGGAVETTTTSRPAVSTTTSTRPGMTFAECQKTAEYPGGRYAVEFDNGVCTVQRPITTTTTVAEDVTPVTAVSYRNCDEVRAAGKDPLHKGEPGYSLSLDRDRDGVACDA